MYVYIYIVVLTVMRRSTREEPHLQLKQCTYRRYNGVVKPIMRSDGAWPDEDAYRTILLMMMPRPLSRDLQREPRGAHGPTCLQAWRALRVQVANSSPSL